MAILTKTFIYKFLTSKYYDNHYLLGNTYYFVIK